MINWYLIHTKPRQEQVALENLKRQGFHCYLPMIGVEKVLRGKMRVQKEALFPRYLFIQLDTSPDAPSWTPIRSTLGVSRLVTFGQFPAKVSVELVESIRISEERDETIIPAFQTGETLVVSQGPFAGLEALYQSADGEGRVMVLLNILSKDVKMSIEPEALRKRY